jgi:hypothetical protein
MDEAATGRQPVQRVLLLSGQILAIVPIACIYRHQMPVLGLSLVGYGLFVLRWVPSALRYIPV